MHLQEAQSLHASGNGCHRGTPTLQDRELRAATESDVCVLLTGQKDAAEALAYRIHRLSAWRFGPFSAIDCAAPEQLVMARLFNGYDPRGPLRPRPDRRRNGGTVLLQEVGKLSTTYQVMLAELLSELRAENNRNGTGRRVIASTTEPLWPRVEAATFDDRLFYRLNVIHMAV